MTASQVPLCCQDPDDKTIHVYICDAHLTSCPKCGMVCALWQESCKHCFVDFEAQHIKCKKCDVVTVSADDNSGIIGLCRECVEETSDDDDLPRFLADSDPSNPKIWT